MSEWNSKKSEEIWKLAAIRTEKILLSPSIYTKELCK